MLGLLRGDAQRVRLFLGLLQHPPTVAHPAAGIPAAKGEGDRQEDELGRQGRYIGAYQRRHSGEFDRLNGEGASMCRGNTDTSTNR